MRLLRLPWDDTRAALDALTRHPHPVRQMLWMALAATASWFVYVPLHELLHVAGCVVTGGSVSELQLDPIYGASLLARWLPFVVPGGEYAGRLSGFDTGGSDWVYLATVAAPYLPSLWPGVALLQRCASRPQPVVLGAAVVLGLAPFYNALNDYYELGSILATRAAGLGGAPLHPALRSDDLPRLLGQLAADPGALGLASPGDVGGGAALVGLGSVLALLLAFGSYAAGHRLASLGKARRT